MLRLIFCTSRIWIPWEERDKVAHFCSFYSKVHSDFIITARNFYSSSLYVDKKITPRNLKQNVKNSYPYDFNHFHSLGKEGRQGALQTCCFSFEIDLLIMFTLLGTKKDKKFSTEWQTFLVVKCLTNTERQLTCPQHVTEHTRPCRAFQLNCSYDISVSHGRLQQTKDVQSWLSSRTVFSQAFFKWLLGKELPAEKKYFLEKAHNELHGELLTAWNTTYSFHKNSSCFYSSRFQEKLKGGRLNTNCLQTRYWTDVQPHSVAKMAGS